MYVYSFLFVQSCHVEQDFNEYLAALPVHNDVPKVCLSLMSRFVNLTPVLLFPFFLPRLLLLVWVNCSP